MVTYSSLSILHAVKDKNFLETYAFLGQHKHNDISMMFHVGTSYLLLHSTALH